MKVLCINPPFKTEYGRFSRTSRSPAITKSGTIYYPIWLCYAAATIEAAGHEVEVIDSCAYGYDLDTTMRKISEFGPELAILDTSTPSIYNDVKVAAEIKKRFPNCFVVLMGTHVSAMPEETLLLDRSIDAVAVGEADYTLREVANTLSDSDLDKIQVDHVYRNNVLAGINGIAYSVNGKVTVNKKRELIANLDDVPFVSKIYSRHLDTSKYFFAASDYPEIQIMTSRGCVAQCTYCVYPQTIHGQGTSQMSILKVKQTIASCSGR